MLKTKCTRNDQNGRYKEFSVEGHPEVILVYNKDADPKYPWHFERTGKRVSGLTNFFDKVKNALDALEDGSWKVFENPFGGTL